MCDSLPHGLSESLESSLCATEPEEGAVLGLHRLGDPLPGRLEPLDTAVRETGDDLHEGGEVVQLDTLRGNLDQELYQLQTVARVTLVRYTPHKEEGHLQRRENQVKF